MNKRSCYSMLVGLIGLAALGCASVRRGEPLTGPLNTQDPQVARGEVLYNKFCHQCHPGGEGGLGPGINDKPAPVWLMKTQVRLGLGVMPSFGTDTIPSDDLDALMAYIVARKKSG